MQAHQIKTVGSSGQISLGKEYAGRTVLVDEIEEGVWIIKTATVIPDNEMWMHEEPAKSRIGKAVAWAQKHRPSETDIEALSEKAR
ncbi:MAG TPA: hypothetical protein VGB23_06830 [Nitrospirota bacterium]